MSAISTAFRRRAFHLQERELPYATGRYMRYPRLSHSFEVEDVCGIVRLNYRARASCSTMATPSSRPASRCTRPAAIRPGCNSSASRPRRGWVVLASDVTHFYENMESGRPFTTAFHMGEMLEGFDKLLALAPTRAISCRATIPW